MNRYLSIIAYLGQQRTKELNTNLLSDWIKNPYDPDLLTWKSPPVTQISKQPYAAKVTGHATYDLGTATLSAGYPATNGSWILMSDNEAKFNDFYYNSRMNFMFIMPKAVQLESRLINSILIKLSELLAKRDFDIKSYSVLEFISITP